MQKRKKEQEELERQQQFCQQRSLRSSNVPIEDDVFDLLDQVRVVVGVSNNNNNRSTRAINATG